LSAVVLNDAIRAAAHTLAFPLSCAQEALLAQYVELVFKWNRITNLIGVAEPAEFIAKHLTDCLSIAPFVVGDTLVDVGSGAGLPGMVLACVQPELFVYLLEPRAKRARFLEHARIALALPNVEVVTARVEAWQPPRRVATIICRAFGSVQEFVRVTTALQSPGCRLLAMKGQDPTRELVGLATNDLNCTVHPLKVPGWRTRHLVMLEHTRQQVANEH
jgi:16S rRNA (guanine527-N7)-methyltransferase